MLSIMLSLTVAGALPGQPPVDAGITPDSPFYFLDELFEQVGNDPHKALEYKEEKIAELQEMAKEKKVEAARKALENAQQYGTVLEKEVTPEMEADVQQSVEVAQAILEEAGENLPELEEELLQKLEQEQRITLAAEISTKIKQLCETLSKLDPVQYAQNCKTDENAPRWQQKYDQELTDKQKKHAASFAEKMTQCFETQGKTCDCEGMGVKKFEELCIAHRDFKQRCDNGEEDACKAMIEQGPIDIFEYLPTYLHPVVENLMKGFEQAQEGQYDTFEGKDNYLPMPCIDAGISSAKECALYMKQKSKQFSGNYQFSKESSVIFGPGPCKDKGITSVEECQKYMDENFQKTPEGAYIVGPPVRIGEFGRDCHAVQDLAEKVRCFENFYNQARGKFNQPASPPSEYPQGMEEWQRSYYDRWLKATTEDERTRIKMEMTQEMNMRNQQYQQQYNAPAPASEDWISVYAQRWFSASDGYRSIVVEELRQDALQRGYVIQELETDDVSFKVKYTDQNGIAYEHEYGSTAAQEELPEIKVKVKGNAAEVEVRRDGYLKDAFTLAYTADDQLVSDLATRLYLSKEEVQQNLDIEFEEADNEAEEEQEEAVEESDSEEMEEENEESGENSFDSDGSNSSGEMIIEE